MSTDLTVSVIICCYTEERLDDIREAVASVEAQTEPPAQIILAVDNNAPLYELFRDEMAERVEVVLNDTGRRGLSPTRNVTLTQATHDVIAFLDDDAIADREWLARLVTRFDDPLVVVAGGMNLLAWQSTRPRWFPKEIEWTLGGGFTWLPSVPTRIRNPHGGNMAFLREYLDMAGPFDESVGRKGSGGQAGEEAALCLRLLDKFPDAKIVFEPSARIWNKVPTSRATWSYLLNRSYQEGRSKARVEQSVRGAFSAPLSTETAYLRHLIFRAIPSRFLRFWRPDSLPQAAAIVLCIAATGGGYAAARWLNRQSPAPEANTP